MRITKIRQMLLVLAVVVLGCFAPSPASAQSQFIVRTPAAIVQAVADSHGLTIVGQVTGKDIFLLQAAAAADPVAKLNDLHNDVNVAEAEQDGKVFIPESLQGAQLTQSTATILDALKTKTLQLYFGSQVWTVYVNQTAATLIRISDTQSTYGLSGTGTVAVIDTGIDPRHSVLASSLVSGFDFTSNPPAAGFASDWADLDQSTATILDQSTATILDATNSVVQLNQSTATILDQSTATILDTTKVPKSFGHGTMVAGVIHLVAPSAKLMPLKAFKADGSSDVFNILKAIYYAAQNGATVINMSFSLDGMSQEFARAVDFAVKNGVTCVGSAGNSGKEILVYPAALRSVVGVASTSNTDIRSTFSNYGMSLVLMAAPGEGIITTYPGNHYAGAWGTSFSAPFLAGAAAVLLQVDPTMSPDKVAGIFSGTGVKISQDLGSGRLNLFQAAAKAVKK